MTKYIAILFIALLPLFSRAQTTYYVSNEGSSSNNGTSTSTTWNLAKLNSSTLSAGDNVLFKREETFYGSIVVSNNGTSGNRITYGAYGSGNNPIITGFTTVSGWTNISGNIWESTSAVSTLSSCNMVVVNGVNTPAGQYPNSFATYQSHSGNGSITSSSLNSATTDWTGANVFIRLNAFEQIKSEITSHSGGTLTFTGSDTWSPTDGYGFFITDDPRTLDVQNEWYYNLTTHKIRIYSTTEPTDVKVASVDNLFDCSKNYITVENLDFEGANNNAVNLITCPGVIAQNLSVNYAGNEGIYLNYSDNGLISNNIIKNVNDVGIRAGGDYVSVTGNTIDSVGVLWNINGCGIMIGASLQTVTNNHITNVGRYGIQNTFGYGSIQYNYINTFCLNANDAGAIYLNGTRSGSRLVDHNIVINGVGNIDGTSGTYAIHGIYLDAHPTAIVVTNNTVTGVPQGGIKVHMAADCRVENNTVYDCGRNLSMEDYEGNYIRRDTIRNNLFFAKTSDELALYWYTVNNDINLSGIFDNNIYVKPSTPSQLIQTREPTAGYVYRSISNWQSFKEATASTLSTWTDVSKVRLVYNNTSSTSDLSLGGTYIDAAGTDYTTVSLTPYQGMLLYGTQDVAPPTVSTSGDQTLITNSTTVFSTSSAADGETITGYAWTDITGSGSATIASPTSQNTGITNLSVGTHTFRITVTQSDGQIAHADVNVTLTAPPTANAGTDQTITLPTSEVTLSGSGTVASGQTASYQWTKISGAGTQIITGNTTLTPTVSGFTEAGDYVFQLKVSQTDTQFASSTVTIHVKAAPTPQTPHIYFHVPTIVIQLQ